MKLNHQSALVALTLAIVIVGASTCFAQTQSLNDSSNLSVIDSNQTANAEATRTSPAVQRIAANAIKSKANLFEDTTNVSPDPAPQAPDPDEWHFQFSPYLWIAGISGRAGIGDVEVEVDSAITDENVKLNSGFMGVFEARKNRFVLLADVQYSNLGTDRPRPRGILFSSAEADFKTFIFDGEAGYRVAENVTDKRSLDIVGGIRVWRLETNLTLISATLAPDRFASATRSWVDAVGGVRGRAFLTERIFVAGKADLGGGGSKFTWQLFGVGGFQVHPRVALVGGYRWLSVNYDKDNFLFDNIIHGPVLGATFIIK